MIDLLSSIISTLSDIAAAIARNPLIYLPLLGTWFITSIYFIINHDEKHGHTYVMSTGIAHVFTAYMISPLAIPNISWNISDLRIVVVIILFAYGAILTVLGVMKTFPDFLAEFFGDPGHALVPSLLSILYIQDKIPIDLASFLVVAVPVFVVSAVKVMRRINK